MYFIYGGQRTITILIFSKVYFRNADELHGLQYVIFLALCEIFFAMLVVVCNNTKLEKLTNNICKSYIKDYGFFRYILLIFRNISILYDGILLFYY